MDLWLQYEYIQAFPDMSLILMTWGSPGMGIKPWYALNIDDLRDLHIWALRWVQKWLIPLSPWMGCQATYIWRWVTFDNIDVWCHMDFWLQYVYKWAFPDMGLILKTSGIFKYGHKGSYIFVTLVSGTPIWPERLKASSVRSNFVMLWFVTSLWCHD